MPRGVGVRVPSAAQSEISVKDVSLFLCLVLYSSYYVLMLLGKEGVLLILLVPDCEICKTIYLYLCLS